MICSEVMTSTPVCCLPNDDVVSAAKKMKRFDIGSIPIIETEKDKKLVGILTDRDLALKIVAEGRDPKSIKIEEVMTINVMACRTDDNLQKALDIMADSQLRRIPVVDSDNRIIGIIAQADVATRLDQPEKTGAMVKDISQSKKE